MLKRSRCDETKPDEELCMADAWSAAKEIVELADDAAKQIKSRAFADAKRMNEKIKVKAKQEYAKARKQAKEDEHEAHVIEIDARNVEIEKMKAYAEEMKAYADTMYARACKQNDDVLLVMSQIDARDEEIEHLNKQVRILRDEAMDLRLSLYDINDAAHAFRTTLPGNMKEFQELVNKRCVQAACYYKQTVVAPAAASEEGEAGDVVWPNGLSHALVCAHVSKIVWGSELSSLTVKALIHACDLHFFGEGSNVSLMRAPYKKSVKKMIDEEVRKKVTTGGGGSAPPVKAEGTLH